MAEALEPRLVISVAKQSTDYCLATLLYPVT